MDREIITDNFDALYAALKPKGVTVSAMLAKAVAEVLKKHPIINAAYVEGYPHYLFTFNPRITLSAAVSSTARMLMWPWPLQSTVASSRLLS